jgi:hypothetical protein
MTDVLGNRTLGLRHTTRIKTSASPWTSSNVARTSRIKCVGTLMNPTVSRGEPWVRLESRKFHLACCGIQRREEHDSAMTPARESSVMLTPCQRYIQQRRIGKPVRHVRDDAWRVASHVNFLFENSDTIRTKRLSISS